MDTMETQAMEAGGVYGLLPLLCLEDSCFGTAGLSVVHPDMEQRRQAVKVQAPCVSAWAVLQERQPLQPGVAPLEASLQDCSIKILFKRNFQEQANLLVEAAANGAGADLVAAMAKASCLSLWSPPCAGEGCNPRG